MLKTRPALFRHRHFEDHLIDGHASYPRAITELKETGDLAVAAVAGPVLTGMYWSKIIAS